MSLTRVSAERTAIALTLFAAAAAFLLAAGVLDGAFAQGAPFGAPRTAPTPPADGIIGWMFAKQAEFYRDMSRIIRAAKTDGTALSPTPSVVPVGEVRSESGADPQR